MGVGQIPGGGNGTQMRPLTSVETSVSVTDAQTTLKAANANRRNLTIQNLGADPVQVHLTTGKAFGAAGILLQVGDIWQAYQGCGTIEGIVYGICGAGKTATVTVTEET